MSSSESWITSPLSVIDSIFDTKKAVSCADVRKFFSEKLGLPQARLMIPSLNDTPLHELTSGSLVRYRCMVQDMFDPEFFLSVCEVLESSGSGRRRLCTAMFRDIVACNATESIDFDSAQNVTSDRQTIYCIPIPGENAWVKEAYSRQSLSSKQPSEGSTSGKSASSKRSVDDDVMDEIPLAAETMEMSAAVVPESVLTSDTKRAKSEETSAAEAVPVQAAAAQLPDLNFPLPDEKGPACLVKVYDGSVSLKLNDVIEIIGILSTDPSLAVFSDPNVPMEDGHGGVIEPMDGLDAEHLSKNPPPSLVPRVHAVLINQLDHSNPCLPHSLSAGCSVTDGCALENVASLREELLAILEHALIGDRLAAEYLLCHLVSCVYGRQNVVALGKFSLNLSGCPADRTANFTSLLANVLSLFVTKSHLLPLSLSNMNTSRFVPKKDYSTNRLNCGLLQLSSNTHLIVDETALEPGQLDATGVINMGALSDIVTWQKLDYDFEFHRQPFHTDIPVLVLSEGKSLLKCDCRVPLLFDPSALGSLAETYRGVQTYLTPHLLDRIRAYLGHVCLLAYTLTSDVQKSIEEDFVASRRESPDAMSIDDFHSLLTLARLLSLSCGQTSLTSVTWQSAKSLESLRKQRLQVVSAGQ